MWLCDRRIRAACCCGPPWVSHNLHSGRASSLARPRSALPPRLSPRCTLETPSRRTSRTARHHLISPLVAVRRTRLYVSPKAPRRPTLGASREPLCHPAPPCLGRVGCFCGRGCRTAADAWTRAPEYPCFPPVRSLLRRAPCLQRRIAAWAARSVVSCCLAAVYPRWQRNVASVGWVAAIRVLRGMPALSPGALRAIRVLPQGCASCGGRLFPPPWVAASVHRRLYARPRRRSRTAHRCHTTQRATGIIPPAGRSPPAPRAAAGSPTGHAPQGSTAPAGHPGRARHAPQPRPASPPCPRGAGQPPTHC